MRSNFIGFEVVNRWSNQELGVTLPEDFIPFAEQSVLNCGIGRRVLDAARKQIRGWLNSAYVDMFVLVNLSVQQVCRTDTVDVIKPIN